MHFASHIRKSFGTRYIISTDPELLHGLRALHPIIYLDTDESGFGVIYNENSQFCCHARCILARLILVKNITNLKEYYRLKHTDRPVLFANELSRNHTSRCVVISVNIQGRSFLPKEFMMKRKKTFFSTVIAREYNNNSCTLEIYLPTDRVVSSEQIERVIGAHEQTVNVRLVSVPIRIIRII